jgi:rod shape-determining protein MreC
MADVVNNSTSKQHNYITLNRGRGQGVRPEMGVLSSDGIVGVVLSTSKNYATVVSMLNLNFRLVLGLSVRAIWISFLGWQRCSVYESFRHTQQAKIKIGDTIETTGYSTIFPEGVFIGVVDSYKVQGGNFFS